MSPSRAALVLIWWPLLDLNQRPIDYESTALTTELRGHSAYIGLEPTIIRWINKVMKPIPLESTS